MKGHDQCILPIRPKEYLKQGPSHCGAYSLKAILSAYAIDLKGHPKEYHPHILGRITGLTFGRQYYPKIFAQYGIKATPKNASKLNDIEKLNLLKKMLIRGNPVMVSIGNGYLPNGSYNSLLGYLLGHWITILGFNDKENIFYIYDSAVPKSQYDKDIPIGNVSRTYDQVIRDWKGSILGRLLRSWEYYHYIEINKK